MSDKLREAAREVLVADKAEHTLRRHPHRDEGMDYRAWQDIRRRWNEAMELLRAALADSATADMAWGDQELCICGDTKQEHYSPHHGCDAGGFRSDAAQPEWPMYLDPEDDPVVLRNMAKVGYVLDEADCDFLRTLAENIERDFATHPEDVPEGPWEQSLLDPTRIILRGDNRSVRKVYLFASKSEAKAVRDALNLNHSKGDAPGEPKI